MAAGPTSLLAFWLGGAAAPDAPVQAGSRSMLAPWLGGAAAPDETVQGGVLGLLAPWIGGAGAAPAGTVQAGFHGLLGLWIGGAAPGPFFEPPVIPEPPAIVAIPGSGGGRALAGRRDQENLRIAMTICIAAGLEMM